jgi:nitrite reductase (NADH) small subunit
MPDDISGSGWKNIGPLENIPARGARRLCVKSAGRPVAVFRTGDDAVFALIDECPHKKGPLSEGIVAGHSVACPLHNWVIGLEDGAAMTPDEGRTPSLPVKVIGGQVFVHIPELVAEMVP